jgi:O-antigen ligase
MGKAEKIDSYAARLMMMCLFMPQKLQVVAIVAVGAWFVYRTVAIKTFPPKSNYLWALIIGSGFLMYVLALPMTDHEHRHVVSTLIERRMSLLLLPVIFSFIAPRFLSVMAAELIYFVYACFITCFLGNVDYVYHYFFWHGGLHQLSHVQYRDIFEAFTGVHPTYLGLYLGFSISILLLWQAGKGAWTAARYLLLYLLIIFLLSLLAKSPVIALLLIGIHYGYVNRTALRQHKALITGMAVSIIIACVCIPFARQRIAEIPQFLGIGKAGNSAENSFYDRKMIFNTDVALLKANWVTGAGPGRMLEMLHQRYFFHSIAQQRAVGYFDPHNEYFSEWLCFGILGIAVFAGILLLHFITALRAKNYLYLYLLLLLSVTFFTETVLSRQQGVLFYAVYTSFFFFMCKVKNDDIDTSGIRKKIIKLVY